MSKYKAKIRYKRILNEKKQVQIVVKTAGKSNAIQSDIN